MSMGVFMPPPAPLMGGGGGGTVLDGTITVGNFNGQFFGWSDGSLFPIIFGSLSGDAASYLVWAFAWTPGQSNGNAVLLDGGPGFTLSFQGQDYPSVYDEGADIWVFVFGPEVASWPTSGTHPFTLTLP